MATQGTVTVRGITDLQKAFKLAGKEATSEMRVALREVAEPVRRTAEARAVTEIRGMARSQEWAQMRTGVTQRSTYVAPRRRNRGGSKRKNLAQLLLLRSMLPALAQNSPLVLLRMNRLLETVGRKWERA